MTRRPEDVALNATTSCVMVATGTALVFIVYALLTFVDLLPASLGTQDIVGLFN